MKPGPVAMGLFVGCRRNLGDVPCMPLSASTNMMLVDPGPRSSHSSSSIAFMSGTVRFQQLLRDESVPGHPRPVVLVFDASGELEGVSNTNRSFRNSFMTVGSVVVVSSSARCVPSVEMTVLGVERNRRSCADPIRSCACARRRTRAACCPALEHEIILRRDAVAAASSRPAGFHRTCCEIALRWRDAAFHTIAANRQLALEEVDASP